MTCTLPIWLQHMLVTAYMHNLSANLPLKSKIDSTTVASQTIDTKTDHSVKDSQACRGISLVYT